MYMCVYIYIYIYIYTYLLTPATVEILAVPECHPERAPDVVRPVSALRFWISEGSTQAKF